MQFPQFLKAVFAASMFLTSFPMPGVSENAAKATKGNLLFIASKHGIFSARIDPKSGELHSLQLAAEVIGPGFLAVHPNKKFLYSVNSIQSDGGNVGVASAFSISPENGALKLINHQATRGTGPTHLALDSDGKNVLVANYGSGSVVVFPIAKDGALKLASGFAQHSGSSIHPKRQTGPHAHSISADPKNRFVFSCDLGLDKVMVHRFDAKTGALGVHDPAFVSLKPGAGPRHHVFHPAGEFFYVINELDSTMTTFRYNAKHGVLNEIQTVSTLPQDFQGTNYPAEVAIHPSGKFVYGSNRGHDSIVVYDVDKKNGALSAKQFEPTLGKFPRHFEIDPDGKFLLAANQNSDDVVVFRIDRKSGVLTFTGNKIQIEKPQCVKLIP